MKARHQVLPKLRAFIDHVKGRSVAAGDRTATNRTRPRRKG
jgi:hypothetical protein